MTKLTRTTIRLATLFVSVTLVLVRLSDAIKSIFVARWFETEEVGMITILLMLHSGIRVFTEMGHNAALVQRKDDQLDHAIDTAFVSAAARGLVLFALLALLAAPIAGFYQAARLTPLLIASGAVFVVIGLRNMHMVRYVRRLELKWPKGINAIGSLTDLTVTVVTGIIFQSIWCVVYGSIAGAIAETLGTHLVAPNRTRFRFSKKLFMELFRYGRNIQAVAILVFLVTQLDDAVVGRVLGLDLLAFYMVAYTLANLPVSIIISVATQVAFPAWSQVSRTADRASLNAMFLDTLRLTGALSFALTTALLAGGGDLISLIFGERWRGAFGPLEILVWFGLIRGISANFGALFNSIGRPNLIMREISVKVVLILALLVPFTQTWGLRGAAIAVTAPFIVVTPIALWIYLRIVGINPTAAVRTLVRPAVCCAILITLWYLVRGTAWNLGLPVGVRGIGWALLGLIFVAGMPFCMDPKLRGLMRKRSPAESER